MRSRTIRIGMATAVASVAMWGGSGTAVAGGGCMHGTGPTTGRGDAVQMVYECFTSTVLYVNRGTQVTWTNRDAMDHQVVGVGGSWGDPGVDIAPGDSASYRFDEDGVYPYACWIHPGMIGAIVVGDGVGTGLSGVEPAAVADPSGPRGGGVAGTVIWAIAAAVILTALAGAFAIAIRGRRKGALAS
jgi:plastocyanin